MMKNLKFRNLLFLSILASAFVSCGDDDDTTTTVITDPVEDEIKSGILTADETWTNDRIYFLDGKVVVGDGVELTIEPGTIVKGYTGQETNASALVVDQGGRLVAEGSASEPIIFTSELDDIEVGEQWGSNLGTADTGLWGGVIILGKAPISAGGDNETAQIEGIAATESYGQYGGTEAGDDSGSIKYISIRHGGITIGDDNEINGLTLGGVGNGTTIENVEIVANQDDGIEFFGGTVDVTNAIVWSQGDDGFDTDQGWSGTLTNGLVIMGSESGTGLELDGPEGTTTFDETAEFSMQHTLANITIIGAGSTSTSKVADLRDGVLVNLDNVYAYNFGVDGTFKINGEDSATELTAGHIAFSDVEVVLPEGVSSVAELLSGDFVSGDEAKFTDNATAVEAGAQTVGADTSVFGWTFASAQGAF